MPSPAGEPNAHAAPVHWFTTTHWSVVLAAGQHSAPDSREALEKLCSSYWYPLYAYVRRQGHSIEDAQDLTQEFFLRLLANEYLALADRERGRFRTFLLTALQRFLVSQWRRTQAVKRASGGLSFWDNARAEARYHAEPSNDLTPEKIYEKRWAMLLLERVLARLRAEAAEAGKLRLFEGLKSLLWGDTEEGSYRELSARLVMSEGALRIAAHRFRRRYRELLQEEIAQTIANPDEIEDEMQHLLRALV